MYRDMVRIRKEDVNVSGPVLATILILALVVVVMVLVMHPSLDVQVSITP